LRDFELTCGNKKRAAKCDAQNFQPGYAGVGVGMDPISRLGLQGSWHLELLPGYQVNTYLKA